METRNLRGRARGKSWWKSVKERTEYRAVSVRVRARAERRRSDCEESKRGSQPPHLGLPTGP